MKKFIAFLMCLAIIAFGTNAIAQCGGPVFLTGDDADDHGNTGIYADIFDEIMTNVTNGQTGILAIGITSGSYPSSWIESVAAQMTSPQNVTYVDGAGNISAINFNNYAIIYIPSDYDNTFNGITQIENDALVARAGAVATFINSGGGLFGNTQGELTNAYEYLGIVGSFTTRHIPPSGQIPGTLTLFDDVTPTTEGTALGITNTNLDHCCFHNTFLTYPSFMDVLAVANHPGTIVEGEATIIGGAGICVAGNCPLSQGYWKNHEEEWPASALPMMLGTVSYDQNELLDILNLPVKGDASLILAKQLIAAKLNIANGSDPSSVSATITDADNLIGSDVIPITPKVKTNTATGQMMTSYAGILDDYNNGNLTPDCIDGSSSSKFSGKVASNSDLYLSESMPNPMNDFATIKYSIPTSGHIKLAVYDITGKQVQVLFEGNQAAGNHTTFWYGENNNGKTAAPGIYIYTLEMGDRVIQKKMVVQ